MRSPSLLAHLMLLAAAAPTACAGAPRYRSGLAPVRPLTLTPDADFRRSMPPLSRVASSEPEAIIRHTLRNGMQVYILPRQDLPIVSVHYVSREAGESGPESGLASLTADALIAGGTLYENGNEARDVRINSVPASLRVGRTHATLGFTVGSAALDQSIRILARTVRNPTFGELSASRAHVELTGPPSRIGAVVDRAVYRLLFGPEHPIAMPPRNWFEKLSKYQEAEVRAFHVNHYRPQSSALIVVGGAAAADVVRAAERWFADWQGLVASGQPPASGSREVGRPRPGRYVLQLPSDAALVVVAQHCVAFGHPDYWALQLLTQALSGTYSSRAQMALRHTSGLSYHVNASLDASRGEGVLLAYSVIDGPDVAAATHKLEAEVDQLAVRAVEGEELANAKLALQRLVRGELGSNAEAADRLSSAFAFGDPIEVLAKASERIESTTTADLVRVARTYLNADQRIVLLVGKLHAWDQALSELNPRKMPQQD